MSDKPLARSIPIEERPSYTERRDHRLVRALGEIRERHGLIGAVLISFEGDNVGVNSSGKTPEFGSAMERLGDRILAAIDDGQFDPEPP